MAAHDVFHPEAGQAFRPPQHLRHCRIEGDDDAVRVEVHHRRADGSERRGLVLRRPPMRSSMAFVLSVSWKDWADERIRVDLVDVP